MKDYIEIDLDSRDEYINEYDDHKINEHLHQYLMGVNVSAKKDNVIRINFNYEVQKAEKEFIVNLLKADFEGTLEEIKMEIRYLNIRDMFLFLLGFLFLIISLLVKEYAIAIFSELFLVFCWVAFWEVAESFLFRRRKLRLKKKRYQALLKAKFETN